ncbi:MAG TPA: hypothetical protein VHQ47_11345 [Phycisphaerae bacterium]|nr:hypothetical protein [Phycisphaerae bacterium]
MSRSLAFLLPLVFLLPACNRFFPSSASSSGSADALPQHPPPGDPDKLPKIPADSGQIRAAIHDRYGEALSRGLRISVEDDPSGGGKKVSINGEVPNDEIRQALLHELDARITNMKTEDFTLAVSGPIRMLFSFDASTGRDDFAAFSPDLSLALTARGDLYESATGRRLNRLLLVSDSTDSMAFSPDGKSFAIGYRGGAIQLFDTPLGEHPRLLTPTRQDPTGDPNIAALLFTPDSQRLVSINSDHGEITLWDLASGSARTIGIHIPRDSPRTGGSAYVAALSPDGKTVASADTMNESAISLWSIPSRSRIRRLDAFTLSPKALAFSHNGKFLAAARAVSSDKTGIALFDLASGKPVVLALDHDDIINALAFSPDDRTLAAAYQNAGIVLWDLASSKQWLAIPSEKAGSPSALAFSPDGATLICDDPGISPPGIRLWDVSQHPGNSGAPGRLPPAIPVATVRDDRLLDAVAHAIRADHDSRTVQSLTVTLNPDGSLTLAGAVADNVVKQDAEVTARYYHLPEEPGNHTPNTIHNDLKVSNTLAP